MDNNPRASVYNHGMNTLNSWYRPTVAVCNWTDIRCLWLSIVLRTQIDRTVAESCFVMRACPNQLLDKTKLLAFISRFEPYQRLFSRGSYWNWLKIGGPPFKIPNKWRNTLQYAEGSLQAYCNRHRTQRYKIVGGALESVCYDPLISRKQQYVALVIVLCPTIVERFLHKHVAASFPLPIESVSNTSNFLVRVAVNW